MASQLYQRVSFESGPLTVEKLNDLVENMDFLYDRMCAGYYFVDGHQKENGLIIQGQVAGVDKTASSAVRYADVFWAKPFTTGCKPIITSSQYSTQMAQYFWMLRAINGQLNPDNRGFRLEVGVPKGDGGLLSGKAKWADKAQTIWSFIGMGY